MSVVAERAPRAEDELVLLTNDAMRARRRPIAIACVWLYETMLALVVAWPASSLVRSAYGDHPRGDAALWNPGGIELTDFLSNAGHGVAPVSGATMVVFLLASLVGLVPLAALIVSIAFSTRLLRAPGPRAVLSRALFAFRSLALVMVLALLVEALLVGIGVIFAGAVTRGLTERAGEARAQQIGWLVALLFVGLAAMVGVAHDLARAAVVRFRVRGIQGLRLGLNTFRRSPLTATWSWAWRAFAGMLLVAVAAIVADRLGGRGGAALFALFVLHQVVVGARVALRASWLAKALRAVDHAHRVYRPKSADTAPVSVPDELLEEGQRASER